MRNNYKEVNNLVVEFIGERFRIRWWKGKFNCKGIRWFSFRLQLGERGFEVVCNICCVMVFIGSIGEIRVLCKEYDKIKKVQDKMVIDYERGRL